MTFTLLFLVWTVALIAAWIGSRALATGMFMAALALSIALFVHHATECCDCRSERVP